MSYEHYEDYEEWARHEDEEDEYAYIIPDGYSPGEWDSLPHELRMVALGAVARHVSCRATLEEIRDELQYYASIKKQIAMLTALVVPNKGDKR